MFIYEGTIEQQEKLKETEKWNDEYHKREEKDEAKWWGNKLNKVRVC